MISVVDLLQSTTVAETCAREGTRQGGGGFAPVAVLSSQRRPLMRLASPRWGQAGQEKRRAHNAPLGSLQGSTHGGAQHPGKTRYAVRFTLLNKAGDKC